MSTEYTEHTGFIKVLRRLGGKQIYHQICLKHFDVIVRTINYNNLMNG